MNIVVPCRARYLKALNFDLRYESTGTMFTKNIFKVVK